MFQCYRNVECSVSAADDRRPIWCSIVVYSMEVLACFCPPGVFLGLGILAHFSKKSEKKNC